MASQPVLLDSVEEWLSQPHICSICHRQYTGWGHNPEPILEYPERCCEDCNNDLIIPWRIRFGRDTAPQWLTYGYGKCAFERVLCAHPFHDQAQIGHIIETPTEKLPLNASVGAYLGGYRMGENFIDKAWYGRPAADDDAIGKAVESVLGKTKEYYGGVPVK